jgi:glycosyltransferase involved in cell wall biosynthesis
LKRVLVLAYHFPPVGGAGVQRVVKFVRYLPEKGWEPTVVTGPGGRDDRWTPVDKTLTAELPEWVPVHRVGPEPRSNDGLSARAERWLRLEAPFTRWWVDGCVELGRRVGDGVDAIFATMSPVASAEAAAELARDLRLPWVADLRDPWALDEMMVYPTRVHRRLELRRMRRALTSADAIVMNTPEAMTRLLKAFPEFRRKHVVTIPNGFDPADFRETTAARDDAGFRIVHTGYLHTEMGGRPNLARRLLGGAVPGVDISTRSHVYLLEAVDRIRQTRRELGNRLEVHLAGVVSESDRATLGAPSVRLHGYLSHPETVALMRSADLLFLPMQELPPGVRATIVPGKTYEYLATGRPILAAVPEGDVRDILAAAGNAVVCAPRDVDAMVGAILVLLEGGTLPPRDPEVMRRYERSSLTGELAEVLDAARSHGGVS